jgi:hypothetical protein
MRTEGVQGMNVLQISVFIENKPGRLAAVTHALGAAGINIRALSIADTSDFGVLRLIVDDPEAAHAALKSAGFTVNLTDVIAVEVCDEPGGLAKVLDVLADAGQNVEYIYAFCEKRRGNALTVCRVENGETAKKALQAAMITVLTGEDVNRL